MTFFPDGLGPDIFNALSKHMDRAAGRQPAELLAAAREHVEGLRQAYQQNPLIDLRVAEAIEGAIVCLVAQWESVPEFACPWCKGMILYFASTEGEEDDLTSPIGLDDDAEVLNACLRLAGRNDLCVDPEECGDV